MFTRTTAGLTALFALVGGSALATPMIQRSVAATPVFERVLTLTGGSTYTIVTSNQTAGGDPVLHVWGPRYSASGTFLGNGELARDDDSAGGGNARIVFTPRVSGSYRLIMHAKSLASPGTATVLINGVVVNGSARYGGNTIAVPTSTSRLVYETAHPPGGANDTQLYALDCAGGLVDIDDDGGVGTQAHIDGQAAICKMIVGGDDRWTSFYGNDVGADQDGDGLGHALEVELGTCDSFTQSTFCSTRQNLKDSDRDGLSDMAEVFGLDTTPPQYLPRWGAEPLQKDMFVEVDYDDDPAFTVHPYSADDAQKINAFYQTGTAADVGNPNGKSGVRIHLDIGATPTNLVDTTFGSWGGASRVTDTDDYGAAAATNQVAARRGVFRYAFLTHGGGGGQTSGTSFTVAVSATGGYTQSFAHELGHSTGLEHWGNDAWGVLNCKPQYRSLMSYAGGSAFSLGAIAKALNPASVIETQGLGGAVTSFLAASPFSFLVTTSGVDWNRDGVVGSEAVRAGITLADASCQATDSNAQDLRVADARGTRPAMVRSADRLYTFYVSIDGKIRYRHTPLGGLADGGCPGGDDLGDTCSALSPELTIPLVNGATSVSAVRVGAHTLVAFRSTSGALVTVRTNGQDAAGNLLWTGETVVRAAIDGEPEVAQVPTDPARFGADEVIGLFYLSGGRYRWMTAPSATSAWTDRGVVVAGGSELLGSVGATVSPWPSALNPTAACGAFPDAAGDVQLVCFAPASSTWTRLDAFGGSPANTHGRPGLAYDFVRRADGSILGDGKRGRFVLSYAPLIEDKVRPRLRFSDVHDGAHPPLAGVAFGFDAYVTNRWATSPGGAPALFSYPTVGALKAAVVRWRDSNHDGVDERSVELYPLADGTVSTSLSDGNDFHVMERGICARLRGTDYCGTVGAWGL